MVTIKMIAKECGYSAATVSKALNGAPDISAETAELIKNTAARMGYMPNSAARALKTTRTYSFGILYEDSGGQGLTHEFFSQIINSFKHRAEELGYDLFFLSHRLGGRSITHLEHARYRNCDGVLILLTNFNDPNVHDLASSEIPVVSVDYEFNGCGAVLSDNIQGIRDLVTYIHSMGHRKIALIHGEDMSVTRTRVAGFYKTCRDLGLEIPGEYVIPGTYHSPMDSARATRELLALPDPPTCILYPDDISYIGGVNELKAMGLSVPEDISAAGYDGIRLSQAFSVKITTMQQDADSIGIQAAEELARAVAEGRGYIPGRLVIPGKLISGDTVKKI